LTIDIISGEADGDELWQILAINATHEEARNMNAFYGVYYEGDGVYLELYEARGGGKSLDDQELMYHLGRKNIVNLAVQAVQNLTKDGMGRAKIALPQTEVVYGEDINVVVAGNEMEASVRLLPPEENGKAMTIDSAKIRLLEAGVTHGVDESALISLIESKKYNQPYVIARATAAIDGEDGKLIFHFSTDERTGAPRELGCGRVDYRALDLYVPVEEGQLLVTRECATEGAAGTSVRGNEIKQRVGRDVALPRGKNVDINEEKTEMHAVCSGMVEFVNNTITVSSVYKINGDCDLKVGNIDFDGSVQVSGTVRAGHIIKASAGISVGGGVEAATLIAGGNVEVKGGMQGSSKGRIEAGGSVSIMYIERGTVVADGPITVDVSIHSTIETGSTLHAKGKRGAIIGGQAGAAGDIIANYIGAISNTKTEIEVGVMPRKRARIQALEEELERIATDFIKLDQLDTYLEKTVNSMDKETWEKLQRSGQANRKKNEEDFEAFTIEIGELKYELEHATESKVHVLDTVFSGSRIVIGSDAYKINDEISYATFKYSNGEVVWGTCEISKGSK
jgi:hypothetical protein